VINTGFLQQLELKVNELLQHNKKQQATIQQLNTEIEVMKRQLQAAHVDLVELQKKYDNLLIAQTIVKAENGDIKRAKAKLTKLLDTIDRCIGKLSV
jgi:predicted  nucleic acid-binding Zn-ribbon protein